MVNAACNGCCRAGGCCRFVGCGINATGKA